MTTHSTPTSDQPVGIFDELLTTGDPFARIVNQLVVKQGITWYGDKKRRRRRAYWLLLAGGAATSAALVAAAVVTASTSQTPQLQIPTGLGGVMVGAGTSAIGTADLRRHWDIWTDAQEELEHELALWELAMVNADHAASAEDTHQLKQRATDELIARSRIIRRTERQKFFRHQPETPSPDTLAPSNNRGPSLGTEPEALPQTETPGATP